MKNERLYIVVEECWEYNDEYYCQPNDEPYTLTEFKLFTLEEAERLMNDLNEKCQLNNVEWDEELDDTVEISIKPYKIIKLEQ